MTGSEMHESFDRDEVKASSDRSFGLVFAAVFAVVACWPTLSGEGLQLWAVAPAVGFLATAVIWPRGLHPLNRAWLAIGTRLGPALRACVGLAFDPRIGLALDARVGPALGARVGPALGARLQLLQHTHDLACIGFHFITF